MIAELGRVKLGEALENYLSTLAEYCDRQEADDNLSTSDFRHVYAIREALAALAQYDDHTEKLLDRYREALAFAQQPTEPVPTLEHAILCQLSPAELLAHREADPVYRLGYVRGYEKGKQQYERLAGLYAQHATLTPPASYVPSPLVSRITKHLATPNAQAYGSLPPETKQALHTLNDIPTNGIEQR